jgi:integrase
MGKIARLFAGRRPDVTAVGVDDRTQFRAYVRLKSGGTITESTLDRYETIVFDGTRKVTGFLPWLQGQPINAETVAAYHETVLLQRYRQNSRVPICSGLNWFLRWKRVRDEDGEDLRFPIPATEAAENARVIADEEYAILLRHLRSKGDLRELAAVMVQRDTGMRPCDVAAVPLGLLDLEGDRPRIRGKRQQKTRAFVSPFLRKETANVVRRYVDASRPRTYLFEVGPGRPFHRRWILEILRRACKATGLPDDITPRTFRRTLATSWKGDIKDLQAQGGWADVKTILKHYRLLDEERHYRGFEDTFEPRPRPGLANEEDPAFR